MKQKGLKNDIEKRQKRQSCERDRTKNKKGRRKDFLKENEGTRKTNQLGERSKEHLQCLRSSPSINPNFSL